MTPQATLTPDTRLPGRWLVLARAGWLSLTLLTIVLYLLDLPVRFDHLRHFFAHDRPALLLLGQSPGVYARYFLGLDLATMLLYTVAATVIYWRKSDDWFALFMALTLVTFGAANTPATDLLQTQGIEWRLTLAPLQTLARGSSIVALYLFPDGRFVPRWTWPLSIGVAVWLLSSFLFPAAPFSWYTWPYSLFVLVFSGWYASGVWAQIYRYLQETNPIRRQQTKWVVLGFTLAVVGRILFAGSAAFLPSLHAATSFNALWLVPVLLLAMLLVPVTFTLAILRYRLWDIDLIIRRTLLYGTLTVLLAVIYFASVVLLQRFFQILTSQGQNPFVTIVSTLAIAALFTPLRRRLQHRIDRRFYRRKYDAAQSLAAFNLTARNETDLARLSGLLVTVVEETMQPAHVSLWLQEKTNIRAAGADWVARGARQDVQ